MRTVLALGVLGLVFAVSASGSTPAARILFNEASGTSTDLVTLDADGTNYKNLTPGQAAFYVSDADGSWSPDGSKIAFMSHRDSNVGSEVYVMDADGSNQKRLTHDGPDGVQNSGGGVFAFSPLWSPKGDTIAYLKSVNGQWDIWLMSTDGSGQHALTTDGGTKTQVSWSPDGTRIAYQRQDAMFVVSAGGGPPHALPSGFGPAWSPDGTRVAYGNADGVWTVGADGRDARQVTTLSAQSPSWSPDGTRIAFVGTRIFPELTSRFGPAGRSDIYTVRADGAGLQRLTGPFDEQFSTLPSGGTPTWWPDGSRIFFGSARGADYPSTSTTYQMNADGSCEGRFVAVGAPQLWRPLWRPGSQPGLGPIQCVDLRLTLQPPAYPGALGAEVPIQFLVDNDGSEPATAVQVELKAAATVELGGGPGCSGTPLDVVCKIDSLPPRTSRVVGFAVPSTVAGGFPLTATAGALEPDSDPSTNIVQTGVQVLPCTRVGTYGDDVLYGTPGPDRICALTGRDEVYGGSGNDYLDSGNGADIVTGGPGNDTILTKGGNDTIYARDGQRDWIDCGTERDVAIVDRIDRTFRCETVVRPKKR